ncbi:hypothetical protein PQ610_01415 [Tardisphaera miroshnichenkoae]
MKAIEPDLRAGGKDLIVTLKRKGYRLALARRGAINGEDLALAKRLGVTILIKGSGFDDEVIELPLGKGRADVYTISARARHLDLKPGEGAVIVNLKDYGTNYLSLSRLIERNPGTRFLFTVGPARPEDVKDPRDLLAFLVKALGMDERRALDSITRWPL